MPSLGPELQLPLLVLSSAAVYALCHLLALALLRLLRVRRPLPRVWLPWLLFQAYLVVGLFVWGGLPAPAGGMAALAALNGGLTVLWALLPPGRRVGRAVALLAAWAVVWLGALAWSVL